MTDIFTRCTVLSDDKVTYSAHSKPMTDKTEDLMCWKYITKEQEENLLEAIKAIKTYKEVDQYKITDPAMIKLKGLYIMDRGERL